MTADRGDATSDEDVAAAREVALTEQVVASFDGADPPRFRAVMGSLVRHLHGFIRDVRLTQAEWESAIEFLTATGRITDDRRQEFVLLSDVLGASMMTVGVNEVSDPRVTASTAFGPFFTAGSPRVELGADLSFGAVGGPCWAEGAVRDVDGSPVAGARVEVWEADEDGFYDVQYDGDRVANRGHLFTDDDGGYRFWSVRPAAYPIPADGPVGRLLHAAGRGPMRPAHVHFMISAAGFRTLTTHVFAAGDPHLTDDAVFGVTPSLIARFADHEPGGTPPGGPVDAPWSSLHFDVVLARDPEPQPVE